VQQAVVPCLSSPYKAKANPDKPVFLEINDPRPCSIKNEASAERSKAKSYCEGGWGSWQSASPQTTISDSLPKCSVYRINHRTKEFEGLLQRQQADRLALVRLHLSPTVLKHLGLIG